jgi:hypothetical protein
MIHTETEDLLAAGAVLDDLAPDERAEYDAHRATCATCRSLEVDLDHVLADLALAAPDRLPPPDLLAGIRAAIAVDGRSSTVTAGPAEPDTVTPDAPVATHASGVVAFDPARSRRSQRLLVGSLAVAAAFGIVAVGLGSRTMSLQQELDTATAQVVHLEDTLASAASAATVAMNPSHVTIALHAEPIAPEAQAAVMFLPGSTSSWIVAENLPATPDGHGYQLWYADSEGVHGLQTVPFDGEGAFWAPIDADLASAAAVMITLEPSGGATGEPGPQVVFGEL